MPENISVILSEPRPDDPGVEALADSLAERLAGRPGLRLAHVANLYDLEPAGPVMESIRRIEGDLVVLSAFYPRATFWTLKTAGVPGCLADRGESAERAIWCLRLHPGADAGEILGQIDRIVARARGGDHTWAWRPARAAIRASAPAVVPGDRSPAVLGVPGVPELLPVRRVWRGCGRRAPHRAARRLPRGLPGVQPDLPGRGDHVSTACRPGHRRRRQGLARGPETRPVATVCRRRSVCHGHGRTRPRWPRWKPARIHGAAISSTTWLTRWTKWTSDAAPRMNVAPGHRASAAERGAYSASASARRTISTNSAR